MSKKVVKLLYLALTVCLVLSISFTGCSTTETDKEQNDSTADTKSADKTTDVAPVEKIQIRLMSRWTGSDANAPAQEKLVKEFNESNPDIEIIDESIGNGDAYSNKIKIQVATGSIPHIFQIWGEAHDYAKNGIIADLKPYFDEDTAWSGGFLPGLADSIGKFPDLPGSYVIPMEANFEPFFYNTELFAEAGITKTPDTFEELLDVIVKLKDADIVPIGAGAKDSWRLIHIYDGIWFKRIGLQKATDLASGKVKFTDPDVVDTFKIIKQLVDIGAFDENMGGIDYASETTSFLAGKTAMIFNGTWFVGNVASSDIKDKIKTFLMPPMSDFPQNKDYDTLFGGGFVVSNFVKDEAEKNAMIKVAKYISGPDASDTFLTMAKRPSVRTDGKAIVEDPLLTSIIEQAKGKIGMTDVSNYTLKAKMGEVIGNNLVAIAVGSKTPEEAAKAVQAEMEKD